MIGMIKSRTHSLKWVLELATGKIRSHEHLLEIMAEYGKENTAKEQLQIYDEYKRKKPELLDSEYLSFLTAKLNKIFSELSELPENDKFTSSETKGFIQLIEGQLQLIPLFLIYREYIEHDILRIFEISSALAEKLLLTDVKESIADINLPMNPFFVKVKNINNVFDKSDTEYVIFSIYKTDKELFGSSVNLSKDRYFTAGVGLIEEFRVENENKNFPNVAFLKAVIMYINMQKDVVIRRDPRIKKIHQKKKKTLTDKKILAESEKTTVYLVGQKIKYEPRLTDAARNAHTGQQMTRKQRACIVRGHFRQQWYGPLESEERTQKEKWIEPFWRGLGGEKPAKEVIYKVK